MRKAPFTAIGRQGHTWRVLIREVGPVWWWLVWGGWGWSSPRIRRASPRRRRPRRAERAWPAGGGHRGPPGCWIAAGLRLDPVEAELRTLAVQLVSLSVARSGASRPCLAATFGRRALIPLTRMATAARAMTASKTASTFPARALATSWRTSPPASMACSTAQRVTPAPEAVHRPGLAPASDPACRRDHGDRGRQASASRRDRARADPRPGPRRRLALAQVVEALLFLARADAEGAHPRAGGHRPRDLAGRLPRSLVRTPADRRRPTGDRRRSAADPGHPELLGQLSDNLVENAFKYSPAGSPVMVRAWSEAGCVALVVEDRGVGISAADLPHIFEPFYRSEGARREVAGVGLGLAVVQAGRQGVGGPGLGRERTGRGARFTVEWPIAAYHRSFG